MTRITRRVLLILGCVACLALLPVAIAISDIVGGVLDNEVGILTNRAINAVRASREGTSTIGAEVTRAHPHATWSAQHDDDDSLLSVRVTADSAEWCVYYEVTPGVVLPHFSAAQIFPANRAAQILSPSLGSQFDPLPTTQGSWACSAIQWYFKKDFTNPHSAKHTARARRSN